MFALLGGLVDVRIQFATLQLRGLHYAHRLDAQLLSGRVVPRLRLSIGAVILLPEPRTLELVAQVDPAALVAVSVPQLWHLWMRQQIDVPLSGKVILNLEGSL